jgi:hypothetical protein
MQCLSNLSSCIRPKNFLSCGLCYSTILMAYFLKKIGQSEEKMSNLRPFGKWTQVLKEMRAQWISSPAQAYDFAQCFLVSKALSNFWGRQCRGWEGGTESYLPRHARRRATSLKALELSLSAQLSPGLLSVTLLFLSPGGPNSAWRNRVPSAWGQWWSHRVCFIESWQKNKESLKKWESKGNSIFMEKIKTKAIAYF